MELRDYLRILRKNWLVIVVMTLVGIGAAAAFSLTRTPMYQAQSTVFVSTQTGSSLSELVQGNNFSEARVTTYVQLVSTPIVINPVIAELDLQTTAASLATRVTASSPLNSTLIQISVQDPDPVAAADIANALASSLTSVVAAIETPEGQTTSPVKLSRVQDALPSAVSVSPNVMLNLVLGGVIGLVLGLGIAVLRTVLDNKVRSVRDVEQLTDRPIIGAIPFDPKSAERPIILQSDPHNARSEAFRALRTNLQFLEMDGGHSFVVTSSVPSEGKSTTAVNLAVALADAGKRVALLDTDLRKPKVAEYLGVEGGAGLTDVLIGRARIADVMLPWGNRPLYVLPAGKIPPNPSELLGSAQMSQLLDTFTRDFDVVILDAPPLLPVTDAAILTRVTTGAIVVVASGRTAKNQFEGALDALETVSAKVAGIVVTMLPTRGADAYGYGYGYGGYGAYAVTPETPRRATGSAEQP
jgi:capsular exopolysaccharide synthesis family protein